MTRKRGVGQKRKKESKGRDQGWESGKAGGWPSTCPPYCRLQVGGPLGTPVSPGAGAQERGLAGRDKCGVGWEEAVYLGFAHVLPGPLKLQPEVRVVRAALEGVQLDPEDALHLQPLPLHPGLRFGLHHNPFLRRRVAPGQEHGCPARPCKEGAQSVTGVPAREAPPPPARGTQATPPAPSGAPRPPPPRPKSRGLADPPATAPAPALPSSVPFGGGSRDNLFLPGAAAGGGTGPAPAALPSAPSLSPSPLRQPFQDELLLSLLGSLTGRGRRRGGRAGEGGGGRGDAGEGPGNLCLLLKFWAQSQKPGARGQS